jgi:hypothetical protein
VPRTTPRTWRTGNGSHAVDMTTTRPVDAVQGGVSLLLIPLGGFVALPLGATLLLWRIAQLSGMQVFGYVLGVLLMVLGSHVIFDQARARHRWDQRRAAISLTWLGVVFGWGIGIGPSKVWVGTQVTGGIALGLWWFFVKTEAVRGYGADRHGDGEWQRAVGLSSSTRPRKVVKDDDDERIVEVEHTDDTRETLQKARPNIESKGRIHENSITIRPVMQAGRAVAYLSQLVITKHDRLAKVPTWSGPDQPGEGIWVPVPYGWAADGKRAEWQITPTEDFVGAPSAMVVGVAGAAKTAFQRNVLGTCMARRGVTIWANDTRKAGQWVPFMRPGIDWFEHTIPGARAQIEALRAITPERTRLITDLTGLDRWTPICWTKHRIPFLLLWMAESAPLLGPLEEELKRINEAIRSIGAKIVVEVHRASESNIDTDLRNLIPESFMFRVMKHVDATMGLQEETLEAGAAPETFTEPGYHYAETLNEAPTRWAMKRRTERDDPLLLAKTAAEYADSDWHDLDPVTARAAGPAYARRERVTVANWLGSDYGKVPQLRNPEVLQLIKRAEPKATTPPAAKENEMPEPETPPTDPPGDVPAEGPEDEEIAMRVRELESELDAEVNQELGPDPDTPTVGDLADELAALEAATDADPDPITDFSFTEPIEPAPSPQQRAENFRELVRRFFQEPKLGGRLDGTVPGERWVIVDTEAISDVWTAFPGEGVRTSIYPRLRAHVRTGKAKQLRRGQWALSEKASAQPLVIPDDWTDPDDPDDPDEMADLEAAFGDAMQGAS